MPEDRQYVTGGKPKAHTQTPHGFRFVERSVSISPETDRSVRILQKLMWDSEQSRWYWEDVSLEEEDG